MTAEVASYYSQGSLLDRLNAALLDDGADPAHPTVEALAPYDHFHGRGLEATVELADRLQIRDTDKILDIGSGFGGPARYFAQRFGCHVTGVDLTAEFCDVARELTRLVGLEGLVRIELGDALAMPFGDATFDGAYSMNVTMNIADKAAFYREIHRVLKPGAWLALSELAKGTGGDPSYPTPWASSARTSFLATPQDTRTGLAAADFDVIDMRPTLDRALAYGIRSRAMVERGEKPPHRAVTLVHGYRAREAMANIARGIADACIVPIEVLAKK